jgi:hypothetical protein
MGMPSASATSGGVHYAVHLDVLVDGRPVLVPARIGTDPRTGVQAALSTDDASGVVRVDSPVVRSFTLGEVFDVWGVALDDDCVGARCDGMGKLLYVWIDGRPYAGSDRNVPLAPGDEITLALGTSSEMPSPVPKRYVFPGSARITSGATG